MDDDIFLFEEGLDPEGFILFDILGMGWLESIPSVPTIPMGGRRGPMSGSPHKVLRQRTEEEEEQLRLLKLLNLANSAKSLKRWQEAENENARQKHNKLLFSRLGREAEIKKTRGQPDVKRANKEIAKRDEEAERKRQEAIRQVRLSNLEKARKSKKS